MSRETLIIIAYSDYLYGRKRLNNISSSGGRETREEGRLEGSRGGRRGEEGRFFVVSKRWERDIANETRQPKPSLSISLSDPTGRYQLTVQTGCPCTVGGIRTFIGRKSKTISAKNGSKMSRDAYEKKRKMHNKWRKKGKAIRDFFSFLFFLNFPGIFLKKEGLN